ncbi:MAG: hypothetical protein U5P41_07410 [Gammaproteobacteria bacterium]|nr:hypothetical protein [Gammaproteobacteria bacterium]
MGAGRVRAQPNDAVIRELYPTGGAAAVQRLLPYLTRSQIYSRVKRLGVRRRGRRIRGDRDCDAQALAGFDGQALVSPRCYEISDMRTI